MSAVSSVQQRRARSTWFADLLRVLAFAGFLAGVFFPYLVQRAVPLPYEMFAVLWLYSVAELVRRDRLSLRVAAVIVLPALLLVSSYYFFSLPAAVTTQFGVFGGVIREYLLVPPIAVVAGALLLRDPRLPLMLQLVRAVALITAVLAVVEYLRGSFLFPGNVSVVGLSRWKSADLDSLPGGGLRALVATEHPLVLGALLATAVPLALRRPRSPRRLVEAVVLLAGIYATGSSGPLLLAVGVVLVGLLLPQARWGRPILPAAGAKAIFVAALGVFLALTVFVWQPVVDQRTGVDASTQYRFALYSLLPRIISTHFFGYGVGEVPAGRLLLEHNGPSLDAATTVDSELMLLVIQGGVIGLLLFSVILFVAYRALLRAGEGQVIAAMLFVLTMSGLFLALHVWASMGPFWEVLIGAVIASWSRPRKGAEGIPAFPEESTEATIPPAPTSRIPERLGAPSSAPRV